MAEKKLYISHDAFDKLLLDVSLFLRKMIRNENMINNKHEGINDKQSDTFIL